MPWSMDIYVPTDPVANTMIVKMHGPCPVSCEEGWVVSGTEVTANCTELGKCSIERLDFTNNFLNLGKRFQFGQECIQTTALTSII